MNAAGTDGRRASAGPLAGTLVVGLEHSVAGPLCTRILADLGADVIKVERPPSGDFSRHWDENVHGDGAQFWWLNRGKRSIALDLKDEGDKDILDNLLQSADVLVQNMSPTAADRLGLHTPDFEARHPLLVTCDISGYGDGTRLRHRKAYDMLVQAESGVMSLTGLPEQPMRVGVSICDVSTGIYAAMLVVAALAERSRSGSGRRLDVSMFDVTLEFLGPMLLSFMNAGVTYDRLPDRHHAIAPYGLFRCRDGLPILLAIEQDAEWHAFATEILGRPDLADDARFSSNGARIRSRAEVDQLVADAFSALTGAEAIEQLDRLQLAYGVVNDMEAVSSHAALESRRIVEELTGEDGTSVFALAGIARRSFGLAPGARSRPPAFDEDGEVIRREFGRASARAAVRQETADDGVRGT